LAVSAAARWATSPRNWAESAFPSMIFADMGVIYFGLTEPAL
jgi:hypothetical protein